VNSGPSNEKIISAKPYFSSHFCPNRSNARPSAAAISLPHASIARSRSPSISLIAFPLPALESRRSQLAQVPMAQFLLPHPVVRRQALFRPCFHPRAAFARAAPHNSRCSPRTVCLSIPAACKRHALLMGYHATGMNPTVWNFHGCLSRRARQVTHKHFGECLPFLSSKGLPFTAASPCRLAAPLSFRSRACARKIAPALLPWPAGIARLFAPSHPPMNHSLCAGQTQPTSRL